MEYDLSKDSVYGNPWDSIKPSLNTVSASIDYRGIGILFLCLLICLIYEKEKKQF